jgi:hypothetical protein
LTLHVVVVHFLELDLGYHQLPYSCYFHSAVYLGLDCELVGLDLAEEEGQVYVVAAGWVVVGYVEVVPGALSFGAWQPPLVAAASAAVSSLFGTHVKLHTLVSCNAQIKLFKHICLIIFTNS